jgi:hypothetical protein
MAEIFVEASGVEKEMLEALNFRKVDGIHQGRNSISLSYSEWFNLNEL